MTKDIGKEELCGYTPRCLICSCRIKVTKRNCYGIFDKHVTEASGTALCAIIAKILEVEITEDSVHSSVICKSCFKMLNEVDDMEVRTEELKRKINASYQESIRMLNELNLNPPEHCKTERKISPELPVAAGEQNIKLEGNTKTEEHMQQDNESEEQGNDFAEEDEMDDKDCDNETQVIAADCVPDAVYSMQVVAEVDVPDEFCNNEMQQVVIYGGTDGECSENIQQIAVYDGPDVECIEYTYEMPVGGDSDGECNENTQEMPEDGDPDGDCTENFQEMPEDGDPDGDCTENFQEMPEDGDPDGDCTENFQEMPEDGDPDGDCTENFQEMPEDGDPDGECNEHFQEMPVDGGPDGENSDDLEEVDAAGSDDPDYIPNPVVDTDMKPLMKKKHQKATIKKTNNEKACLPEKLVERDGIYYVCLVCNGDHKIMGDRKGILAHLKDIHGIRVFICDICLQCFIKQNDLSEHLDNHVASEEGEFHCKVCSSVFHNIRLLEVHKRLHFPQTKLWTCDTCGKSYSSRNMLDEHVSTHVDLRPYACEDCGKTFVSKYTYKVHMKAHEGLERSFACGQCGKAFFYATSLKQHEQTHSDMRNYVCEQCGKAFITARYLEIHSIIHTGYKPFVCQTCGKDFARRNELVIHERTHTGERPFQCEFCGATFSRRNNLHTHKRDTHYQDKRFKCTLCDKGFKRQRLLDYHTKAVHTGERPYKCPTCDATFIYPHSFKKHMRMHMKKV